jgi:hypothetical protein
MSRIAMVIWHPQKPINLNVISPFIWATYPICQSGTLASFNMNYVFRVQTLKHIASTAAISFFHSCITYNSLWILSIFCEMGSFLWGPQHGREDTHRTLQQLGRSSIFHNSPRIQHQNTIIIQYCGQTVLEHWVLRKFTHTSKVHNK